MSKITKLAQRIMLKKTWWQKLLFWRKYHQLVNDITARSNPPHAIEREAKLYRQKDQKAMTIDNVENDCDFVGNLPLAKGLSMECGIKYWVVFKSKKLKN